MTEPTLAEQIAAVRNALFDFSDRAQISRNKQYWAEQANALRAALATLEASQTREAITPLEVEIRAYVECYGNRCDSDKSLEFRYLRSTLSLLDDERKRVAIRPNHAAVWQEAEDAKRFDDNLEAQFNCFEEAVEGRTPMNKNTTPDSDAME